MIAVATNVLVRLLTRDDPKQSAAARSLFAAEPVWIAKTVLLETGWVHVRVEDDQAVAGTLALTSHGIEFADALHLSSRPQDTAFVSFDRSFVRRAQRVGLPGVSIVAPAT